MCERWSLALRLPCPQPATGTQEPRRSESCAVHKEWDHRRHMRTRLLTQRMQTRQRSWLTPSQATGPITCRSNKPILGAHHLRQQGLPQQLTRLLKP